MATTIFDSPGGLGAKLIKVYATVTNISGSYTATINDERVTSVMEANDVEIEHPEIFNADISVTCNNGSVTISCDDVSGESDIVIRIQKVANDPTAVTSSEFDILDNRKLDKQQDVEDAGKGLLINDQGELVPAPIEDLDPRVGDLSDLVTTDKSSIVNAINDFFSRIAHGRVLLNDLTNTQSIGSTTYYYADFTFGKTMPSTPHIAFSTINNNIPTNADLGGNYFFNNVTTTGFRLYCKYKLVNYYIDWIAIC